VISTSTGAVSTFTCAVSTSTGVISTFTCAVSTSTGAASNHNNIDLQMEIFQAGLALQSRQDQLREHYFSTQLAQHTDEDTLKKMMIHTNIVQNFSRQPHEVYVRPQERTDFFSQSYQPGDSSLQMRKESTRKVENNGFTYSSVNSTTYTRTSNGRAW